MANETGHVKNVANFKTLIAYLDGLGAEYNPSVTSSQLPALQQVLVQADAAMIKFTGLMPAYSQVVDEQEAAFAGLAKLTTKISSAYTYVAGKEAAHTTESLKKAIHGTRPKKKSGSAATQAAGEGKASESHSTSQLSYDKLQQNFAQLVAVVAEHPAYNPAETELKVTTLTTYSALLKTKTEAVDGAYIPILNARVIRDEILYEEKTGMLDLVKAIKDYLKSVYGASGPQVKYVNTLKFRKKKQ